MLDLSRRAVCSYVPCTKEMCVICQQEVLKGNTEKFFPFSLCVFNRDENSEKNKRFSWHMDACLAPAPTPFACQVRPPPLLQGAVVDFRTLSSCIVVKTCPLPRISPQKMNGVDLFNTQQNKKCRKGYSWVGTKRHNLLNNSKIQSFLVSHVRSIYHKAPLLLRRGTNWEKFHPSW